MTSQFSTSRLRSLFDRMQIPGADDAFELLHASYSESWRAYHNLQHIDDCLRQFDASPISGDHPDELLYSIWFHDVIYDTKASDNEQKSAELAVGLLRESDASDQTIDRVHSIIMSTTHNTSSIDLDEQLMIDIDLSILGRVPREYKRFETSVREEYSWVSWTMYSQKRSEILRSFLDRDRIFATPWFFNQFESNARENLSRAIADLSDHPSE